MTTEKVYGRGIYHARTPGVVDHVPATHRNEPKYLNPGEALEILMAKPTVEKE